MPQSLKFAWKFACNFELLSPLSLFCFAPHLHSARAPSSAPSAGVLCEANIDDCSSAPCLNGATCVDGVASFSCNCIPGYTGNLCNVEIDDCSSNPCKRGVCIDQLNDFLCNCPEGWGGKTCDVDLESCPVETTILDTGEFQWPATHHGEVAALTCPYGITTAAEKSLAAETAAATQMTLTTEASTAASTSATSSAPKTTLEYEEDIQTTTVGYEEEEEKSWPSTLSPPTVLPRHFSHHSPTVLPRHFSHHSPTNLPRHFSSHSSTVLPRHFTLNPPAVAPQHLSHDPPTNQPRHLSRHPPTILPPIKGGYTTHAEWEGGMIHINRRTRNAELSPEDKTVDASVNSRTSEREDKKGARRRFISSRIRGASPRNNRKALRRRQQIHSGRSRGGQQQFQQAQTEVQGSRSTHTQGTIQRRFGLHSQPRIGENPVEHARIGEISVEHARIGETSDDHARIGEIPIEYARIGETPRHIQTREKPFAQPRIGELSNDNSQIEYDKLSETPLIGQSKKTKDDPSPIAETLLDSKVREPELRPLRSEKDELDPQRTGSSEVSSQQMGHSLNNPEKISVDKRIPTQGGRGQSKTLNIPDTFKRRVTNTMAVRRCVLLPNGTVEWVKPDATSCRSKATLTAENASKNLASLTSSPSTINAQMFTHAAQQLAMLVEHALHDSKVANSMVSVISNMMEVNDSVLATDEQGNTTNQLVKTIETLTENVPLDVGEKVEFRSNNLVVEARLMKFSDKAVTFRPHMNNIDGADVDTTSHSRRKREVNSSSPTPPTEPYLMLPSQVLSMAETENVRLEFVSYGNDKFFRGGRSVGMPVISAKVTNSSINNLSNPVVYYIPTTASIDVFQPSCVYWDDQVRDWSSEGVKTVITEGVVTCEATHLTAFSVLLDPLPAHLGVHEDALSIITYIGLALSTAGLAITVATYTIFRTLNRDRSGKIVMNLSLALLLLNLVFIAATQIKPPSIACTVFAAALHYLVISAFAWMLVEGANMYQLLITVFASAETHFMVKRVIAAWGSPVLVVIIALVADRNVYGDEERNFCVINPTQNPAVYYSTYMGPICCVLAVNCVVFVMVTRVLCQRRPRSKAQSPSGTPQKESVVTLAQVRGAVTVVALLGVTWVAGAFSVGWARLPLQYLFCLTTPLQGLIIFVVRVAQHPEARAAWITLLTTGTLRRRPQPTHTHSTHSSGHTHSTTSSAQTPPRNNHSSSRTRSTRASPATSLKTQPSIQTNGSLKHRSINNGNIKKAVADPEQNAQNDAVEPSMSSIFSRIVKRLSLSSPDPFPKDLLAEDEKNRPVKTKEDATRETAPAVIPHLDYPLHTVQQESFAKTFSQESYYHSNGNGTLHRPQSLVLLRSDSHGGMSTGVPTSFAEKYFASQIPSLLSSNVHPQALLDAGVPASMIPRRSLGSLLLLTDGKEGDDSSWHFVRPPPDGRSDPLSEREVDISDGRDSPSSSDKETRNGSDPKTLSSNEMSSSSGCIVLAGQRIVTDNSPIIFSGQQQDTFKTSALTRASSELHMGSPQIDPADLRRSSSVFTLGEWEDPRSSQA